MNVFNTNTVSKKNNTLVSIYKQTLCLIFTFNLIFFNSVYAAEENIVYVCVADDGTPTYTNNKVGLTNCKPLSGVFVTTIPAFKIPAAESQPSNNNFNNNSAAPPRTTSSLLRPSNFPREDASSQRQRDELGRRPILENELRDREARCAATTRSLRAPLPRLAGETDAAFGQRIAAIQAQVERCNADLAAIRRELAALK